MKKRILAVLLSVALLLPLIGNAGAAASVCFVAINDSVPTVLAGNETPYYSGGRLYIPYTAFNASPNGVGASYNAEKNTFVLFNKNQTLIFNIKDKSYTDNKDKTYKVDLSFRGGVLYIPARLCDHFGLSVTLLYSRKNYPIIRFTNGGQVYDDGTFVNQAESLINRLAEQYIDESKTQQGPGSGNKNPQQNDDPETAEIYFAFTGSGVSQQTLRQLAVRQLRCAFFLTEEQIRSDGELVRAIYAGGHTIGLTVQPGEMDIRSALRQANDALDETIFCRSVFVLLPPGSSYDTQSYYVLSAAGSGRLDHILRNPGVGQLYVADTDAQTALTEALSAHAAILQLTETTF